MTNEYPELNRELLTKVVDHALSADNWNQKAWATRDETTACGTSYCIAGFVAFDFADHKPDFRPGRNSTGTAMDGGFAYNIARDELGLTDPEADALFHYGNSEEDVIQTRDAILAGEFRSSL